MAYRIAPDLWECSVATDALIDEGVLSAWLNLWIEPTEMTGQQRGWYEHRRQSRVTAEELWRSGSEGDAS